MWLVSDGRACNLGYGLHAATMLLGHMKHLEYNVVPVGTVVVVHPFVEQLYSFER